jgi:hypothetical protein
MRELGAVRVAADAAHASDSNRATVERAIADAAEAVDRTIDSPDNPERMSHAQEAIRTARALVASLASEIDRARRASSRAAELGVKRPPRADRESG